MDIALYLTFIVTSAILIVIPGPNVLVIISTSVRHGRRRGLQTVLGTSSAMVIQLAVAAFATTWIVESLVKGFEWIRWLGVAYLLYLSASHLRQALSPAKDNNEMLSASGSFWRGFFVSLTNPKTIVFFGAFIPQFVTDNVPYLQQVSVLSATFLILAMLLDSTYALLAGSINRYLTKQPLRRVQHGLSGVLLMGAGAWLALLRRQS